MTEPLVTRRSVLTGLGVAVAGGIAGYIVASRGPEARRPNGTTAANAYGPGTGGSGGPGGGAGGGHALTPLDKVPVGGGIVLASASVVVTRSSDGTLHGFSAICTHQGCTVGEVKDGKILCPCHGSSFDAFTGAVVNGPATSPLPPVPVRVVGQEVFGP